MDWHKEPLSVFFKLKFLPSLEGKVCIMASCLYLALVVLAVVSPNLVLITPEVFTGFAIIFLAWPIVLFVMSCFILGTNHFHTTPASLAWVCGWSLVPFWIWYG